MAFDEGLAQRIRSYLRPRDDVEEKRMFGGLAFMVGGHMCCGVIDDRLMLRVGPMKSEPLLEREHTVLMDFTGRPMRGFLYVEPAGLEDDDELAGWIDEALGFVATLPPR